MTNSLKYKILIIKLRAIGDVVLSTIVISNLRKAFPDAQIDFLTEMPAKDVVSGNLDLDEIITFDRARIQKLKFWTGLKENFRFIKTIRNNQYDIVFDFFGNPRSALITFLSGAKERIGYNWRGRQFAYNRIVKSRAAEVHEAEFHLDALTALNIPITNRNLHFAIHSSDEAFADDFFSEFHLENSLVIGLNSSGGWPAKKWPLPYFAKLADRFIRELNAKILLFWGPGELDEVKKLKDLITTEAVIIPKTDLKRLAALLQKCSLVVSNDSGPMHIAAAVGTPTVGIFGPTHPETQGPYGDKHEVAIKKGLPCLGCDRLNCETDECMRELNVDEVWEVILKCLRKNQIIRD